MNTAVILKYLSDLAQNNNRDWYHAHKEEYQEAAAEFETLVQALISRIGETDSGILSLKSKDLTFKLNRDTRFSHDKSPYLPAFRAHISPMGKLPVPVGYYLMIKPGDQSFLGGGLFADVFRDATAMVRDYLCAHPGEWEQVIRSPDFTQYFQVQGKSLKKVPSGYDQDHPLAEFLKMKCWYLEYPVDDGTVRDTDGFLSLATDVFSKMGPFHCYLNQALADFRMPERK